MGNTTKQQKTAGTDVKVNSGKKPEKVKGPVPDYKKPVKVKAEVKPEPLLHAEVPSVLMAAFYAHDSDKIFHDRETGPRQAAFSAAEQAVQYFKPAARGQLKKCSILAKRVKAHKQLDNVEMTQLGQHATIGDFEGRVRFWNFVGMLLQGSFRPKGVRLGIQFANGQTASQRAEYVKECFKVVSAQAQYLITEGADPVLFCRVVFKDDQLFNDDGPVYLTAPVSEVPEGEEIHYHTLRDFAR